MNIKKLTLIATTVSALSLSPLTYARTESTDMSIIGIEPECSYFADLRFNLSPFGSKGNIVMDKNNDKDGKAEFGKFSWGGSLGVGTEITPGFEVSLVASVMTGIGTSTASSTAISSKNDPKAPDSEKPATKAPTPGGVDSAEAQAMNKQTQALVQALNNQGQAMNKLIARGDQSQKEILQTLNTNTQALNKLLARDAAPGSTVEDKYLDAYKRSLRTPNVLNFLRAEFGGKLNTGNFKEQLANKNYNIRGARIATPGNYDVRFGTADDDDAAAAVASRQVGVRVKRSAEQLQERYNNSLYTNTTEKENYLQILGNAADKFQKTFGNNDSFEKVNKTVHISTLNDEENKATLDAVRATVRENIGTAADAYINNNVIQAFKSNQFANVGTDYWDRMLKGLTRVFDGFFNNAGTDDSIVLSANGAPLGLLYKDSKPATSDLSVNGPVRGARTDDNAYHIKVGADVNADAVRQLFHHEKWTNNLIVLSDAIAVAEDEGLSTKLSKTVMNLLSTSKGTKEYKEYMEGFQNQLKEAGINATPEEVLKVLLQDTNQGNENVGDISNQKTNTEEGKGRPAGDKGPDSAQDPGGDKKTDEGNDSKKETDSKTNKPLEVNLTKVRVALEGAIRVLDTGPISISVVVGVGAAGVTGTIAGEDTGFMWGAEVYLGAKGEYAISESIALTARYTYTPPLFGGFTLKDNVKNKVKELGYTDDVTISSLSMHEGSLGIRFYF